MASNVVLHRARTLDTLPAPALGDWNTYCLHCARWHWGRWVEKCGTCERRALWWIHTSELRLMKFGSPLGRLCG